MRGDYVAPALGRAAVTGATGAAQSWLRRSVHTKPSSRTRQESLWRVHVEPRWGHHAVSSISRPEIRDWIAELNRAPPTVADVHGMLAAILDERRMPANPARGVTLPRRVHRAQLPERTAKCASLPTT